MATRRSERLPRATIAELYGHYAHPPLKGVIPLKSGLTPVTSNPNHTIEQRRFADNVRWLQRRSNANFTSAELEYLDALAPLYRAFEDDIAIDDRAYIAVHPVLRGGKKWNPPMPRHWAEFPMGNIGMGIGMLFDALFAAEWADIPESEVPDDSMEKGYKRFFTRDFTKYATSSYVDAANGVEQYRVEDETTGASTVTDLALDISVVQMALERIEPLLPGNVEKLNVAQRAQMEVDVTITIIHELAHALYHRDYIVNFPEYGPKEVYFQQEVISELGYSIFGGVKQSLRLGKEEGALFPLPGAELSFTMHSAYAMHMSNAIHPMLLNKPSRDYILRLGGLAISAQEWRAYLLNCEAMPYLFRFKPEGRKWRETSTYRGSIQLHASSWPKTDLTPLKSQRANAEIGNITDFVLTLNQLRMSRNSTKSSDPMWLLPYYLVGAPNGIIRRLPLTDPEYQEILRELSTLDNLIFPKGRHLVNWDGGHESLVEWDNLEMETDYGVLLEDNGIHFANGHKYTYDEYFEAEEMEEIRAEMENEEGEKESMAYMLRINEYMEKHPGVGAQETFKQAFWPTWSANNLDGKEEDALAEFMGGLG
ncbi:hypothetical protein DID88_002873 [Monilinia fructigena]|uniref:Uncharacterized protein n=1 Tax=Monilinia fructigena TaxID=38457 RepID=A0A395INF1_9HELO|nr:hypothetical protein DID88_002873 [Monilinia fructigena]